MDAFCDYSVQEKLIKLCNEENLMLFRTEVFNAFNV